MTRELAGLLHVKRPHRLRADIACGTQFGEAVKRGDLCSPGNLNRREVGGETLRQKSSSSWPKNSAIDFHSTHNDEQQQHENEHRIRRGVVAPDGPGPRDAVVQIKKCGGEERDEPAKTHRLGQQK